MKKEIILFLILIILTSCNSVSKTDKDLAFKITDNGYLYLVKEKAKHVLSNGLTAGDGYGEIWIRDFNTFIDLALDVNERKLILEKLLIFFNFQGRDGNIIDAYIHKDQIMPHAYDYIYSVLEPTLAAHKNTVETDQETSLIQAVYKYITKTGDTDLLLKKIDGKTVAERMEFALEYLLNYRYNDTYGLIFGATTVDWGDVQPETRRGVVISDETHYAIDIYDNAMMVIAMKNYLELVPASTSKWVPILNIFEANIRKHLWDSKNMKFRPHVYIENSPFPSDYDEDAIFYHGGTAIAIEAGLLTKDEIKISLSKMINNMNKVGAHSIGLTIYPAYPDGFFKHPILTKSYTYQNGGDWTWFGGRMIQQLVNYGFIKEAYEQLLPFLERIIKNDGFYEWYTIDNKPKGSATYRGSAGVIYKAILLLETWANNHIENA